MVRKYFGIRHRLIALLCLAAMSISLLTACGTATTVTIEDEAVALASGTSAAAKVGTVTSTVANSAATLPTIPTSTGVRTPTASGTTVYQNTYAAIDASNLSQGYVMVKYKGTEDAKLKVQITKSGGTTYTYNLTTDGSYVTFPMSQGNGTYQIAVFKNVSGTSYVQLLAQSVTVKLTNELLPFLYPNQYVDFTANSTVVAKAKELVGTTTDTLQIVSLVYNYVVGNISYDYNKAKTVQSGYLPNVDSVLKNKTGICFDYAAVMVAMLRSQNIPTKLVVGYTGTTYHAWVTVFVEEVGWVNNVISFDGVNWKLMDPTFASTGKSSSTIMQYINNSANYQEKYCY
jgi:hypothetical protein